MAQALREALEAATTEVEEESAKAPEAEGVAEEVVEASAEAEGETAPEASSPTPGEEVTPPSEQPTEAQEAVETPYSKPPASWKDEAKEVWAALPEKARREVTRRERQITAALQETAGIRQTAQQIEQVAQHHSARLAEWKTSPAGAFQSFMDADRNLSQGSMESRAAYMASLIKEYQIDFSALDSALAGNAPPPGMDVDARVQAILDQRLAPLQNRIQQEEQVKAERVATAIQDMESNPDYPYFEDVREEMADLIEINFRRGVAISLDEAYSKIVGFKGFSNPLKVADAARKAKASSVSVSGAPAAVINTGDPADLRGTILRALGDK